jgi:hypothetical protein
LQVTATASVIDLLRFGPVLDVQVPAAADAADGVFEIEPYTAALLDTARDLLPRRRRLPNPCAGINTLFDEHYNSFGLNATRERYYEPAPERKAHADVSPSCEF